MGRWFIFILLLLATEAYAQSNQHENFGPRELAVGESNRANSHGALATTLNPAGASLSEEMVFEGSYGFRPIDSASILNVSVCDSTGSLPGCYYYRFITASPTLNNMEFSRSAHEGGVALAKRLHQKFSVGVTSKYYDYNTDMSGREDSSGFAMDAGIVFNVISMLNIGITGYNLLGGDNDQYQRAIGGGLALRPMSDLSMTFDGIWALDDNVSSAGRFGGGLEYFLRSGPMMAYPLRAGAVYDSALDATYLTAGLGFNTQKFGLDVGARQQVQGGDEFIFVAGLRFFGPRQVQGSLAQRANR